MLKQLLLLLLCGMTAWTATAADLTAVRFPAAPKIDGKLDDAVWAKCPAFTDFSDTRARKQAQNKTEVRFGYDNNALYVGIKSFMKPGSRYVLNDKNLYAGECVDVMLDPGATGNTYFHFEVNPNGAKVDEFCMQGGFVCDAKFETFWDAKAYREKDFWSCELRIPFASLDFPPQDCLTWGVNVTRTARGMDADGQSEDSAIADDGAFHIAGKFRKLTGFDRPFTAYSGWRVGTPRITTSYLPGKIAVAASLPVFNSIPTDRKAMVVVDLISPDEKAAKRQSRTVSFAADGSETLDFSGFVFDQPGDYLCRVSLRDAVTKQTLKKLPFTVPVRFQLMHITLIDPHYKDAIFATMKLDKVRFEVKLSYPAAMLKEKKLTAGIRDASGKLLTGKTVAAAGKVSFEFDAAPLPEGKLEIFAELADAAGQKLSAATHRLRKLPYLPGEVYLAKDRMFVVDGKRQFVITQWAAGEDFLEGADVFLATKSYRGTRFISSALSHNRWFKELKKQSAVSQADAAKVTRIVAGEKNKEGLFAYFLTDEPEVFSNTVEAVSELYRLIDETDPYHPVIINNDSLHGIQDYAACHDLNGLHAYPRHSRERLFANFGEITEFCDMYLRATAGRTTANIWLAQGFDYTNYGATRTRIPSYIELRNEHLIAIISGATGVELYNRFNAHYPEIGVGLAEFVKELKAYAPALAAEQIDWQLKLPAGMRTLVRRYNGKYYIFAANASDRDLGPVEFRTPALGSGTLKVMTEARTVPVADGNFTDRFAPWDVHVYTDDPAAPVLRSRADIENEIDRRNAARKKPGNLAYQTLEHEHMQLAASSNKAQIVRPDNCLWHLCDGVIEPPDFKHYRDEMLVWTDKTPNAGPDWVVLDFGKPVTMGRVVLYPVANSLRDYQVQVWQNGEFRTVKSVTQADGPEQAVTFDPVQSDKVRIFITATRGPNVKISEIEVYEK